MHVAQGPGGENQWPPAEGSRHVAHNPSLLFSNQPRQDRNLQITEEKSEVPQPRKATECPGRPSLRPLEATSLFCTLSL